jgi:hypothetical protein
MKEFGQHGTLKDVNYEGRRALFTDITRIINDNKTFSVASTLTSEQFREAFVGIDDLSMYGACFTNLAMLNGVRAQKEGYRENIAYLLDTGNRYKHQILEAHAVLCKKKDESPLNVGTLGFDSDDALSGLQAADVVSWSVRRRLASELKSGFEPLADLFDRKHIEVPYKQEWMTDVARTIHAKMEP